ncbi:hypothetical protein HBI24_200690 [Parastagonospora nodorum]|nr:hypothetical protein HBI24_200690 [Parastagonospora nodorum]
MACQPPNLIALGAQLPGFANKRRKLAPQTPTTIAFGTPGPQDCCPFLSLPGELRNRIYEYAFRVDHIQGTQYDGSVVRKANNEYNTMASKYTMTFETRDPNNWRSVPQQLSVLLSLPQTCRQIYAETNGMPFSENFFDVGLHAIQHFLAVVPRPILDGITVISLWKSPGRMMDQADNLFLASHDDENAPGVWRTLLRLLGALPSLKRVILNVRGGVEGLRLGVHWEQRLKGYVEGIVERCTDLEVEVELV